MAHPKKLIMVDTEAHAIFQRAQSASQTLGAGIDTDIFEADNLEFGGERFWEAYWRTQHTYGGVHEGQSLATILAGLDARAWDKLSTDFIRLRDDHEQMPDDDKNDVFGMVIFLLSMESGDQAHDPLETLGFDGVMQHFSAAIAAESQRRAATAA